MLLIHKSVQPPTTWNGFFQINWGLAENPYDRWYKNFQNEYKVVKETLLREQQKVCAYCERQISFETSQIEHLIPKTENIELVFSYHNLVAVCTGRAKSNSELFCDQFRKVTPIILIGHYHTLADPFGALANHVVVTSNGLFNFLNTQQNPTAKILESYAVALNLNTTFLCEERKRELEGIDALVPYPLDPSKLSDGIRNLRSRLENLRMNRGASFRTAQILYLQRKIERLERKQQMQNTP